MSWVFFCIFGPFFHLNFKHMNMYFAATLWWNMVLPCSGISPLCRCPSPVHWSPAVRTCDWLPAQLQSGHASLGSQPSLAPPSRTPPPLPAASAGSQISGSYPVLMMSLLRWCFTFLSNVWDLYCEFRMINSHKFQTFCVFSGSSRTTDSQAHFIISPGGAGCVTVVITWQWASGTWTDIYYCLQQRLYIVSLVFKLYKW